MHEVLVNRLGGLSLPRKSVVRLTDRPDMTLDVYRRRKTTIQQQQQHLQWLEHGWLFNHGYFKLVLESLTKKHTIAADIIVFGIISGELLFMLIIVCCEYSLESPP